MKTDRTVILVPGRKGKKLIYTIYEVDVGDLSVFLPGGSVKRTDNFYAAQTFVEGYFQRDIGGLFPDNE